MSRQFMGLQLLRLRFSMHSNGYKRCSILQCYHSDFPSAGSCRVIKKCVCFKVKHCLYTRSYSILHPDMWAKTWYTGIRVLCDCERYSFVSVLSNLFPPPVNSSLCSANLLHAENECIYTITCLSNVVLSP